jgi:hypothetical protein
MEPDDEAPLTLSKWPFYLGDALLVVTALAIAILGNWQLTDMQVIACVIAVALGAVIFGLPHVVEYSMRVREERDDRSSELRLLKGHLHKAEAALLECHERLNELESGSGSVDQRCEILASAVDQKLNHASQVLATLSQKVTAIEVCNTDQVTAFAALKVQLDDFSAMSKDDTSDASAEAVIALEAALASLENRLTMAVEPLGSIESRVVVLEASAQVAVEAASAATATATATAAATETSAPARVPRSRRSKADAGLLQRAIQEKQDSASSAVSRIIDSKSKLAKPEPEVTESTEMLEEPVSELAVPNESVSEVTETQELVVELDPNEVSEAAARLPEESEVQIRADLIEDDELQESAGLEAEVITEAERDQAADDLIVEVVDGGAAEAEFKEPTPELEVTEAVTRASPKLEAEADTPVDLFGEVEPAAIRQPRTKANDAVFTASILIGIGNKPFLRGSAGGLSWQIGLPMDFEEIGKWRWVAPADLAGPVELQIYRNDEDPDRNGRHTLDPGQKLEVTPIF